MERPIIFSGEMVRAILDGHKTQTRRAIKAQPSSGMRNSPFAKSGLEDGHGRELKCPYGKPGDILWVKETWDLRPMHGKAAIKKRQREAIAIVGYRADDGTRAIDIPADVSVRVYRGWRPSIHMPKWASRLRLEVKDIRAERVQDISEIDAEKEGIEFLRHIPDADETLTAKELFMILWDFINAKRGYDWEENPWVWVIEFQRTNNDS